MDPFRVLQDWGLGALVFLGLAAQPATFSEPAIQNGFLVFNLQDAFPEELQTLLNYGTEVSITYSIRRYQQSAFSDTEVVQSLSLDRQTRRVRRKTNGNGLDPSGMNEARLWLTTLALPLGTQPPSQVSVRAELNVQGRTNEEAAGLWGGLPAATWQRNPR